MDLDFHAYIKTEIYKALYFIRQYILYNIILRINNLSVIFRNFMIKTFFTSHAIDLYNSTKYIFNDS